MIRGPFSGMTPAFSKRKGREKLINLIHSAHLTWNTNSTAVGSSRCFIISLSTSYYLSVKLFLGLLEFFWVTLFFRIINFSTKIWSGPAQGLYLICLLLFCFSVHSFLTRVQETLKMNVWSDQRPEVRLQWNSTSTIILFSKHGPIHQGPQKQKERQLPHASCLVQSILSFKKMPSWPSKFIIVNMWHGAM